MRELGSLGEMAVVLVEREAAMVAALEGGLGKILQAIKKNADEKFGEYQTASGPFPTWPELAEATKDRRVAAGYTENDPLLASGEMKSLNDSEQHGLTGVVGSKDPKMVFHEFGTDRMPARPIYGPAAFENRSLIEKLVCAAAVAGLIGGEKIHEALGYDFKTND